MYHKSLMAAAVLLTLTASVNAQTVPTAAAPTPTSVAAGEKSVNPFVGKTLSLESHQRSLEVARMDTALMEEQLKQAGLTADMGVMPLKKQVESAQAITARMKEELAQKEVGQSTKLVGVPAKSNSAIASAAADKTVKSRPAQKRKPPVSGEAKPVVSSPVTAKQPRVEVTSILNYGGTRSAVLDLEGNLLTVKQGDNTPLGMVEQLTDQVVQISGQSYKVHSATIARVVISDPKIVDPKMALTATAPATLTAPTTAAVTPMASFPSGTAGTMGRGGAPNLPPLQLPAGVTLLPPASR